MVDTLSPKQRSERMALIRAKNTKPELRIRKLLHSLGYRYRLHRKDLPGKPDIVFPSRKKVIFIHGCFWHGHKCKMGSRPVKSNKAYWVNKIANNMKRDSLNIRELKNLGWKVRVVWECELKLPKKLKNSLTKFLGF
jgi:DNA mismatch endonuclease (patch repair protein)